MPAAPILRLTGVLLLAACGPDGSVPLGNGDDTAATDTADTDGDDTASDTDTAADTAADTGDPPVFPPPCDAWADPTELGALVDIERDEVSGVAPSVRNPGVLWVHEDHGGHAILYAVDTAGNTLGTLSFEGVENTDWEALAIAPCGAETCLWVGDIGDNALEREEVALYRVPEPAVDPAGGFALTVNPDRFPVVYADAPRNVEALALDPAGRAVFLTKRTDGLSEVFVVDELVPDVPATPRYVTTLATRPPEVENGGAVTSLDLWPDGTRALVRTYDRVWELDLGETGIDAVATAPERNVPFAPIPHTEALAYDPTLRGYWQIAEAENAAIIFTGCRE